GVSYFLPLKTSIWNFDRNRILVLSACVVLSAAAAFSLFRTIGKTGDAYQVHDFGAYYRAASHVIRGETPYVIDEHGPTASFVYAPAFAYFLAPLSYLDYTWASRLWMIGNWTLFLTCVYLAMRLVAPEEGNNWKVLWMGTLPVAGYFWINISSGQVGALMTALCLGWTVCQRQGRPFVGGILLALATALKLAPALLAPYLIVRRDWRGLAGFLAGGLALILVPAPWTGLDKAAQLHLEWGRHCQETQIADQTSRIENQSFLGAFARLPGIDLPRLQQVYPLILLGLAGTCYGWICWSRKRERVAENEQSSDNLQLASLLILMTLAHPRAWTCNFVSLTLPCFILADRICRRLPGWKVALGAWVLLILVRISPKCPIGESSWIGWIHQGKDFWAALAVAAACCWSGDPKQRLVSHSRDL
ncbi:MAG TPA: glycosyltransferase family 87 protein, partial [Gemmataceae bacterium]|nr:glycosyltransferase family 87 protein [Gemmataceae bacterium]